MAKTIWVVPSLSLLLLFASCIIAQPAPTGMWCEFVNLPSQLPFNFAQRNFWEEYYSFNATNDGQVTFKVYPGLKPMDNITFMVDTNNCPVFYPMSITSQLLFIDFETYSPTTATLTINAEAGNSYILFIHINGANYSIVGCEGGSCPEVCPNDCTNMQGICNVVTKNCTCLGNFTGDDCGHLIPPPTNIPTPPPHHHKKVPFGSMGAFIAIVVGSPTILLVTIGTVILFYLSSQKRKQMDLLVSEPLLLDGSNTTSYT